MLLTPVTATASMNAQAGSIGPLYEVYDDASFSGDPFPLGGQISIYYYHRQPGTMTLKLYNPSNTLVQTWSLSGGSGYKYFTANAVGQWKLVVTSQVEGTWNDYAQVLTEYAEFSGAPYIVAQQSITIAEKHHATGTMTIALYRPGASTPVRTWTITSNNYPNTVTHTYPADTVGTWRMHVATTYAGSWDRYCDVYPQSSAILAGGEYGSLSKGCIEVSYWCTAQSMTINFYDPSSETPTKTTTVYRNYPGTSPSTVTCDLRGATAGMWLVRASPSIGPEIQATSRVGFVVISQTEDYNAAISQNEAGTGMAKFFPQMFLRSTSSIALNVSKYGPGPTEWDQGIPTIQLQLAYQYATENRELSGTLHEVSIYVERIESWSSSTAGWGGGIVYGSEAGRTNSEIIVERSAANTFVYNVSLYQSPPGWQTDLPLGVTEVALGIVIAVAFPESIAAGVIYSMAAFLANELLATTSAITSNPFDAQGTNYMSGIKYTGDATKYQDTTYNLEWIRLFDSYKAGGTTKNYCFKVWAEFKAHGVLGDLDVVGPYSTPFIYLCVVQ